MIEGKKVLRRSTTKLKKPRQGNFEFPNGWGGVRKGAGRKPVGKVAGVSHRARAALAARFPVHVTMKVREGLPSLRRPKEFAALRGAISAGCERGGFRLVHFSVQSNHLHLLAEGGCRLTLARGLQGLAVRMARALNRLWRRWGSVFADRYHDHILRSPSEVRNALRYVLCNARKHGSWSSGPHHDPCSSAAWFDGWREGPIDPTPTSITARARTWLLSKGWRRRGLLGIEEAPTSSWIHRSSRSTCQPAGSPAPT
jgi:REP element-mobilizing transposase RayT